MHVVITEAAVALGRCMTVNRCRLLCTVCKLIFIYRVEYQHDCQACFLEVSDSASRRRCQANTCLNKRASCVSPLTSELTMRSLSHCNSLGLQDGFNAPTNIMLFAQQQWQYGIQDALCKQCAEQYGTSMRRAVWHFNAQSSMAFQWRKDVSCVTCCGKVRQ